MEATRNTALPARRHARGVSLIELCIVVVLVAVLAGLAAPGMRDLIDARRLEGTATRLAADIQYVRTEAVARNEPLRLSLLATAQGSCYVIHTGAASGCRCETAGPAQCSGGARELRTVAIASAEHVALVANVSSVAFDPLHGTASPTGTLRLLGPGGRAIHHVINVMGRVRSCSPLAVVPGYRAC